MNRIVEFFEKYPITEHIIFKGFEAALIVFVATILYVLNVYLKYNIMNYHPILKKYANIAIIHHQHLISVDVTMIAISIGPRIHCGTPHFGGTFPNS